MKVVYRGKVCDIRELVGKKASLRGTGISGVLEVHNYDGEDYPIIVGKDRGEFTMVRFNWDILAWDIGRTEPVVCWLYVEGKKVYPYADVSEIEHISKEVARRLTRGDVGGASIYFRKAMNIVKETDRAEGF
ncbi:MAG: hypothetical protein ACTSPB_16625 [Candidatus Thorarchaeota archaeon]